MKISIPGDVVEWIRAIFADCNRRVSQKLMEMPTTHEESLDFTFIETLSRHAAPIKFPSDWIVRVDTHYLGGRRHFYSWEIADIGILVIFRKAGTVVRSKISLLQSKRLYPREEKEAEEAEGVDYEIGFARLFRGSGSYAAIAEQRVFTFTDASRYQALVVGGKQYRAIQQYEKRHKIPVFYLLYHPWQIPYSRAIPVTGQAEIRGDFQLGCRVLPSAALRRAMSRVKKTYSPTYSDICASTVKLATPSRDAPGWRVEEFVADLVLGCKAGYIADKENDPGLELVFARRGGPIAAAIAITFDAPEDST